MARETDLQKVARRVRGVPVQHTRLTSLEALLLRALYDITWGWSTEGAEEVAGHLKEWDGHDDKDCELLQQLLEEERADRQ